MDVLSSTTMAFTFTTLNFSFLLEKSGIIVAYTAKQVPKKRSSIIDMGSLSPSGVPLVTSRHYHILKQSDN